MKRITAILLTLVLSLSLCTAVYAGETKEASKDEKDRIEGEGYETYEDALLDYMEYFFEGDLGGMLSTFAVETYVENYDIAKFLERAGIFSMSLGANGMFSGDNEYAISLKTARREASLTAYFTNQYIYYSMIAAGIEPSSASSYDLDDYGGEADYMLDELFADPFWIGADIEILGVVAPEDAGDIVPEAYFSSANQENIERIADWMGADEIVDAICVFTADGEQGCQFMQIARYGDVWYNVSLTGNLATICGLDVYVGGLIGPELYDIDIAVPDKE